MTFGLIGGDRRQAELKHLLERDGHTVAGYGLEPWGHGGRLEEALACETVVLPLPLCREEGMVNCSERLSAEELFRHMNPQQRILAGQVKPEQQHQAERFGLHVEDYFLREDLAVANAAITAECAVQTAMERMECTLLGMDVLVIGFGRIGKLLCRMLQGMGACVTAAARRPSDQTWICTLGMQALDTACLDGKLNTFGVVFNTVPSMILEEKLLVQLPRECLCVELASVPGMDLAAAEEQGLSWVWARSLPGRLRPKSAAAAIRDTVYSILKEE